MRSWLKELMREDRMKMQMAAKKVLGNRPSHSDRFGVVIFSSVEEWLRVAVVRPRIDE